jgi:hypothetical protein
MDFMEIAILRFSCFDKYNHDVAGGLCQKTAENAPTTAESTRSIL